MDSRTLKNHQRKVWELKRTKEKIAELNKQLANMDTISGKVQASMKDFPYTPTHLTVSMANPVESDRLKKNLRSKEIYRDSLQGEIDEVESFLDGLKEGTLKTVCEAIMDGESQRDIADMVGCSQARISQMLKEIERVK